LLTSTATYPDGGPQPSTWADFFDRDKFPGRRGIRDNFRGSWLVALSALHPDWYDDPVLRLRLGAPTDADVQEALDLWYTFSPEVFWHTGSDCPQLLLSGELDMCTAWNGRIFDAQAGGAPLGICWECGHLLSTDGWLMVKGIKENNPEAYLLGQLFMAWSMFPETAARIAQFISYGPGIITAIPFLDEPEYDASRAELPSSAANIGFAIMEDEEHTGLAIDEWKERWLEVIQQ
ncbi:MAG: extracellular solute-binding protein, partial [Chloroflexi bacterium]|nr:extracellular solute-binding protein [Chloroflexota bacterium]